MPRKGTGKYTDDWVEIANQIKEEAGWKCARCGHPHEPSTGYCLTVHHLDGKKGNNAWFNIPPLCQRCHLTIQSRVIMERVWMYEHSYWFKPYAAGYYASINNHPTNREWVMEHLDFLLDYGKPK